MDSPLLITVPIKSGLDQSVLTAGVFRPGNTLKLKVLELNGNRALIDFGVFCTRADVKVPVTVGDELLVKVQDTGSQLRLGLLRPDANLMAHNERPSRRPPSPGAGAHGPNPSDLKSLLIQVLGSSSLKTVPGQMLKFLDTLSAYFDPFQKEINAKSLVSLRKRIDFLLSDIIQQQGRVIRPNDSAEPFQLFSFTFPLTEDRPPAQLKMYYPKKQQDGSNPGFRVSLLLALDRLGELRTDFFLLDRDLSVTFFVKSQLAYRKIMQYQMDIQQLLNPLFNQTVLRVVVSERKIDDFEREDVQIAGEQRVDLRV